LIAKGFLLAYALLTFCFGAALLAPQSYDTKFNYVQNYGTMTLSLSKYENKRYYPLVHEIDTLDYAW
jgi:hypothetical protein